VNGESLFLVQCCFAGLMQRIFNGNKIQRIDCSLLGAIAMHYAHLELGLGLVLRLRRVRVRVSISI